MIDENPLDGPAIIIVGYVAAFNPDDQPPRWLYTGIHLDDFNENGIPVHSPMNEILPIELNPDLIESLEGLNRFNTIIFTSRYAVRSFFDRLLESGLDARSLAGIKISSVGKVTSKELKQKGILALPVSDDESVDGIIEYYNSNNIRDERILIPCSSGSRSLLTERLNETGNVAIKLPVFRSEMPDHIIQYNLDEFAGIVFTSPMAVDHFKQFYNHLPDHLIVKVKGKQTAKRLKEFYGQCIYETIK
jgi:uroporphyrinogen III methyltransferase/synthase